MAEVLIPGDHIKDWQSIRSNQWNYVKSTLLYFNFTPKQLKEIKPLYIDGFESSPEKIFDYSPEPIIQFWLCGDQSKEVWNQIWEEYISVKQSFDAERQTFLKLANDGEKIKYKDGFGTVSSKKQSYGAFGGLEKQMLEYFIPATVYTDEEMEVGRSIVRKIPWDTPERTFIAILLRCLNPFKLTMGDNQEYFIAACSPFTPYQWMHSILVSTFSYDIEATFNENSEYLATVFLILKSILDDTLVQRFHPNHVQSGLKLIEIFEDEGTPAYLRKLWLDVRDGRYPFQANDIVEWNV